jgi:antitoxin (DNA-binding transcriptional repressor) of toxin-antitoxin stability system
VTSNGRPVAILSAVNESNLEESLSAIRQARAAEAVMSLQRRSVERGAGEITPGPFFEVLFKQYFLLSSKSRRP